MRGLGPIEGPLSLSDSREFTSMIFLIRPEFVILDAAILRYEAASSHPHAIRHGKKDRPRAVEHAREGVMNSKALSCVQAIAAAGILMLSSYGATTAFGEDASGVPDSALKGKKVAYANRGADVYAVRTSASLAAFMEFPANPHHAMS
jgi:hypothetical protein